MPECRGISNCHFGLLLFLLSLVLQVIAISTSWWGTFQARTDLGKPKENGHYGLWSMCSTKGPHWDENCDPLDTFFTFFPISLYNTIGGIFGILHLVLLLAIIFFDRLMLFEKVSKFFLRCKAYLIGRVFISGTACVTSLLVIIFTTIGQISHAEYYMQVGWSFWIQVAVVIADFAGTVICTFETYKLWQLYPQLENDPEETRTETYANPAFNASVDAPEISYTAASRYLFQESPFGTVSSTTDFGEASADGYDPCIHNSTHNGSGLTFANGGFQENSPQLSRAPNQAETKL